MFLYVFPSELVVGFELGDTVGESAKKEKIYAVHDRSLQTFLASIGLLDKMKKGEVKCTACEHSITLENLGFIFPYQGDIRVCCDDPKCYYQVISIRKERESRP